MIPPHRHNDTSKTVIVCRGKDREEYYDDLERVCCASCYNVNWLL